MAAPLLTLPPDGSGEGLGSDELVFCSQSRSPLLIHKALLTGLTGRVTEAVRTVPRGGAEVGGLLVASSTRSGFVRVRQILPVPIEYRFGPTFRPSPNDIAAFERAASLVQVDPTTTVVGFYRSATREPKYLRDTDHQILAAIEQVQSSYARDFRFVMILTSVSKSSMLAEVAICEAGAWQQWQPHTLDLPLLPDKPMAESSDAGKRQDLIASADAITRPLLSLADALRTAEMGSATETRPGPVPLIPSPLAPATDSATVPSGASEKSRAKPEPFLYLTVALFLLLGLSGVYYGFNARRKSVDPLPAPASVRISRMGFAANPEGGIWKLTWNRDAVTALNPSSASLSIRDGVNQQQIPLTTAELGAGMVFYTPQSGDLVFGLKLLLPGAPGQEEEVRVLQAIRPSQTPAQPSVQILAGDHRIRTVRPFVPPPQEQQQSGNRLAEPPVTIAGNRLPVVSEIPPVLGSPSSVSAAGTTVPYASSPVPQNLSITPISITAPALPAGPRPSAAAGASYLPPRPVRRVTAKLPIGVVIGNPVEIQIKVEINAAGKVTKASPLKVTAMSYALINPAVRAAESWEFAPALENGRPVPSDMILAFQFAPK